MFMWNPVPSLHTESVLTKEDLQLQTRQGSEEEELEVGTDTGAFAASR